MNPSPQLIHTEMHDSRTLRVRDAQHEPTTMLDDIRLDDGARSDLGARRGWYSV